LERVPAAPFVSWGRVLLNLIRKLRDPLFGRETPCQSGSIGAVNSFYTTSITDQIAHGRRSSFVSCRILPIGLIIAVISACGRSTSAIGVPSSDRSSKLTPVTEVTAEAVLLAALALPSDAKCPSGYQMENDGPQYWVTCAQTQHMGAETVTSIIYYHQDGTPIISSQSLGSNKSVQFGSTSATAVYSDGRCSEEYDSLYFASAADREAYKSAVLTPDLAPTTNTAGRQVTFDGENSQGLSQINVRHYRTPDVGC